MDDYSRFILPPRRRHHIVAQGVARRCWLHAAFPRTAYCILLELEADRCERVHTRLRLPVL